MVRSKTIHFSEKKITFFYFYFFCYWLCKDFKKKVEKSCDARFLGDKTVLRFFLGFQEKVEKITFFAFFSEKSLWSHDRFHKKSRYLLSCKTSKKQGQKKCQKKGVFIFWNSFLKMKIGHLFLSILEFKKKVLKTINLSFSPSRWNLAEKLPKDPPKSRIPYFFTRIAFSEDLLMILK